MDLEKRFIAIDRGNIKGRKNYKNMRIPRGYFGIRIFFISTYLGMRSSIEERFSLSHGGSAYSDFLTVLRKMPRGTKEEKAERWERFRRYPLHDEFILDLMDTYQPNAFKGFRYRLNDPDADNSEDLDMASFKHMKGMDPAALMEVVQRAVCTYTVIK